MPAPALSRKTLADLKRRHLAFLEERLTSEKAREDWIEGLREAYDHLLTRRIRDVVEPAAITDGLHRALTADSVRNFFAPLVRDLHRRILDSLRADETSVGDYVPPDARREIDALLERRDLVPDALVRKVFEQQVVVDAIGDTLYDGLLQFNTSVNPFFADWGLPSILKRMPIGGGMILASMEAMRSEFERRLEPEIRKFVAVFSRRAAAELAEAVLTRGADPKFIELRKNVVAFLYTQSLSELLAGVQAEAADRGALAAEHVVLELLVRDRRELKLRGMLERFVEEHGNATVGDWLEAVGVSGRPHLEGWAELTWPAVREAMRSPVMRDYLGRITAEFYDSLEG